MRLRAGLDWYGKSRRPGIRSPELQPVGSRYTDYVTLPTASIVLCLYFRIFSASSLISFGHDIVRLAPDLGHLLMDLNLH